MIIAIITISLGGMFSWRPELHSNTYSVEVQWGGSSAKWNDDGVWILGGREKQRINKVEILSSDNGMTFTGTVQYEKEGAIGFKATQIQGNKYKVENQWGGNSAGWNDGGIWTIGGRSSQRAVSVKIDSNDNGKTLTGMITYQGEGPISFRAKQIEPVKESSSSSSSQPNTSTTKAKESNNYNVEVQWGGSSAKWNNDGTWVIGNRGDQRVIKVEIYTSKPNTLLGTMQYEKEGSIGFKATLSQGNSWTVFNSWGSSQDNYGGLWVLGGRSNQVISKLNITSTDGGKSYTGSMTYSSEGPIGFRASQA